MKPTFEHYYQERYLAVSWPELTIMKSEDDILAFRQAWMASLSGWHSPYKALLDGSNLKFEVPNEQREAFKLSFERTHKLLSGFFLQKAAVCGIQANDAELLPFAFYAGEEEARDALGLGRKRKESVPQSFRESIQLQNHFQQHVMEMSFSQEVLLEKQEQVQVLKSKITNNLMQWHSAWSLLVDCQNLEVAPELHAPFQQMLKFFEGFFLKKTIGYSPKRRGMSYPFEVVLARHRAAAQLESEGLFSGEDANCQSRRS